MDTIIKAIQNGQIAFLMLAGYIMLFVWLYRESRNSFVEAERLNQIRFDEALRIYAELKLKLLQYSNGNLEAESIIELLPKAYPYLTDELVQTLVKWEQAKDREVAFNFAQDLNEEILRIKKLQRDPVSYAPKGYFISEFEHFLIKTKMNSFFQPFFFLVLLIGSISLILTYWYRETGILYHVQVFSFFLAIGSDVILLTLLGELLVSGRLITTVKTWLLLIVFLVVSSIGLFFDLSLKNFNFIGILNLFSVWAFLLFFLRKIVKPNRISQAEPKIKKEETT